MPTTRRTFMRQVGVSLAGLLISGCNSISAPAPQVEPIVTCYEPPAASVPTLTSEELVASHWQALREHWRSLADSRLAQADSTAYAEALRTEHQIALNDLVAAQALEQDVADHIEVAFEQALAHIQRKQATCYEPLQVGQANPYPPREEVVTQAAALADMAERSAIAPETVAKAQAALARDMAWLEQFRAGGNPAEVAAVEASPAEIEAARVLVALLAETK